MIRVSEMAKKRPKATKGTAEAPTSSCLLLCDDVLMSVGKSKSILQGVVDYIAVPSVPAVVGPYVAYVRLSNVYAHAEIVLRFCHVDSDDEVFSLNARAPEGSNPLGTHTLILRLPPFPVSEVGKHTLQALHGGIAFAESPIMIVIPTAEENQ